MSEIKQLAREMLPALRQEMRRLLQAEVNPPVDHLHGMMQYHLGWLDANFALDDVYAGKQIRPLLCLLACYAAGGDWHKAVPAAAGLELLHNFSLIHDDIEDDSPTRRGRETVWHIWGVPLAINAGDAMFALAHLAVAGLAERGVDTAVVVRALRRFSETCLELTQGQHLDMQFETRAEVSVDEYRQMIRGKTSVLLGLCAELGALVAGCDSTTAEKYADFGLNLGLAFQIQDDILGIWGNEAEIGKSATSDIETRKKTLPVLHGLANSPELAALYSHQHPPADFVAQVVTLLNASGSRAYASAQAAHHSETAVAALQLAQPKHPLPLEELTAQLLKRTS